MSTRPYVLAETNWKTVKETNYTLAILPWGATEAHNYHLPYSTDNIEAQYISIESARKAWEKGAKVVVLPGIPFGVNTGQIDIKLCINMNPNTQYAVLRDVIDSLNRQEIFKLVVLNGHGGNNFRQFIRELQLQYPQMLITELNWFRVLDDKKYFSVPGDHADEMETSNMLAIAPELVAPFEYWGDGKERKFKIKGMRDGWAWTERKWSLISEDTGVGNPKNAAAEKGKKYLEDLTNLISEFLIEFSNCDKNNIYE
ncbi:creatininase family protein [Melioribacteraceae bacterium 4301-Me]|uniref:creatininase family protein n=1 Tax=Pyranulibacter aquaticus TaxID=3163344 RepID=UPI00359BB435